MSEKNIDSVRGSIHGIIRSVLRGWWIIALAGLLCSLVALAVCLVQEPVYQSSSKLYVTAGSDDNTTAAYQGSLASQQRVASYAELASSDAVVSQAIEQGGLDLSASEAKSMISASATSQSVLVTITARSGNAGQAADLSNAIAGSLSDYVSRLESPAAGGPPLARITVVSPAVAASSPVSPTTFRNVVVGLFGGMIVGGLLVIVRARYGLRIDNESDLEDSFDVPVLASIASDSSVASGRPIDFSSGASTSAEGFRMLRTGLSFVGVSADLKSILVTSAVAGEGKSTTSINLARALVEAGKRVCLVDADLRRPQIGKRLGLNGDIGLSSSFGKRAEISTFIQPSEYAGLDVLTSGSIPPNPSELLSSSEAFELLRTLEELYDCVIVDSAPILAVADSVALSRAVDGSVLVVRSRVSRYDQLARAIDQLEAAGSRLAGLVLTDVENSGGSHGYGAYWYARVDDPVRH